MKPYRLHVFVCQGKRCRAKGAEAFSDALKERVRAEALDDVIVSKSGCVKVCKESEPEGLLSPAVVVYPEGTWYRGITAAELDEFVERHLKRGEPLERLVHFRLDAAR
ncbi:MAG TPA: (2Fe-2S) ferredoxin domain-containing protein [Deltaproteobacteria bacterium]|nr:(2Fe-2S) ferredoxin domain-containing protein [Deltaproteobacteria bacterium]